MTNKNFLLKRPQEGDQCWSSRCVNKKIIDVKESILHAEAFLIFHISSILRFFVFMRKLGNTPIYTQ